MNRLKHAIITLLMALCLCLVLLPGVAHADTTINNEASLISALDYFNPQTITLGSDITLDESASARASHTLVIPEDRTLTIIGDGRLLFPSYTLTVKGGGTVVITTSSGETLGGSSATLNLENITLDLNNPAARALWIKEINVGEGATVNMNSPASSTISLSTIDTLTVNSGGKININNPNSASIDNYGTMIINSGGEINVGASHITEGYGINNRGLLKLNGGTLTGTPGGAINLSAGSKVEGAADKFNDQGTVLIVSDQVTVGAASETPSQTGLSAGVYEWDGTGAFTKQTSIKVYSKDALKTALESHTPSIIILDSIYITLDEAVSMEANHILKMNTNSRLTISGNGMINTNGNTLTINGNITHNVIIAKQTQPGINGGGTLNLENITVDLRNTEAGGLANLDINIKSNAIVNLDSQTADCHIRVDNGKTLTINSGSVNINSFKNIGIENRGTVDISGGTLKIAGNGGNNYGIANYGLLKYTSGTLTGTAGNSIYLSQNSKIEGMNDKFDDQGTALIANGQITVGAETASPSTDGLSQGLYVWNDSAFAKASGDTTTVPGAPTNLKATPGDGQLDLSWTAPVYDGGSAITGYKVSTDDGNVWIPTGSTATAYTVTGLTNGTTYTVKVRAVNAKGDGAESGSITATPQTAVITEDVLINALQSTEATTIALDSNITLDEPVTMGASHTLIIPALHTLTISGVGNINLGANTLTINGGGTVVSAKETDNAFISWSGTLNLENITLNLNNTASGGLWVTKVNVDSDATINLNTPAAYIIELDSDGILNVNSGGTINITGFNHQGIYNRGILNINSGGIVNVSAGNGDNRGIYNDVNSLLNLNGGTLTGTDGGAIYLSQNSKVKGMLGIFDDQGTVLAANGQINVNFDTAAPSENGLSAGLYVWNVSVFAKSALLPQTIAAATYSTGPYSVDNRIDATKGTYTANNGGTEGTHTYKWYRANDASGSNSTVIDGAAALSYTPAAADFGKYICIETTPVGDGSLTGVPVKSDYIQIGVKLTAIATGAGGGTSKVNNEPSTLVYNTNEVDIEVAKNTPTDTVAWSDDSAGGTFDDATAADTTYTPPTLPIGDITLTATLTPQGVTTYTVNFCVSGGIGTLTATVDDGAITSGAAVQQGKNVVFTAMPDSNYRIKAWKDNDTPVNDTITTYTITNIAESHIVTVEFEAIPTYTVTVNRGTGGSSYAEGATVSITANAPDAGERFKEWLVDAGGVILDNAQAQSTGFTMPANAVTVTATYEDLPADTYSITVQNDGNGAANANVNSAAMGTQITLTATPDSGYQFKEWFVIEGGVTVTASSFTMPATNVIIQAIFEPIPAIDISAATVSGVNTSYTYTGSAITPVPVVKLNGVTLTANTDYTVTYDNNINVGTATITITGTGNYTGIKTVTFTIRSGGGGGGGSVPPSTQTIPAGDGTVTVSYTQTGETVTLTLSGAKIDEIINKSENGIATLDISGVKNATSAVIPAEALKALAGTGNGVEIKLPQGTVTLDSAALATASENGGNVTVTLGMVKAETLTAAQQAQVKPSDIVLDISLLSGGKAIHEPGGTITVSVPYEGALPAGVWYLNDAGELEKLECSYMNGFVTFTTEHLSLYVLGQDTAWQNPFKDVGENAWYYGDVQYVFERGLMNGTGENAFSPSSTLTRGMLVTILYRAAGSPGVEPTHTAHMIDIEQGTWYEKAMGWAVMNNIISGYGEGLYGPNDPVTREQFVTILCRYSGEPGLTTGQLEFNDTEQVSEWAFDAFVWATGEGIITGTPGNLLAPQGQTTRAEAAAMLHRMPEEAWN